MLVHTWSAEGGVKTVDYFLGAGPHAASRIEHDGGTVEIRMFDGHVVGHGSTAKKAATNLAAQLRMLASYVEAREGVPGDEHVPRIMLDKPRIVSCACGWKTPPGTTDSDDAWVAHVAIARAGGGA
jgi:hypothetical protein